MVETELIKLYLDTKKKLASLVEDMTFSNFLHALQSGKRVYTLKNTKIKKTIDEDWVGAIKECIPHLDAIVNNPRKYMKREQEVVPVEKARLVDADSVKHLAAHTNLISSVENGEVMPNKILASYNEESLELYENRFVMTLITRLWQFVDRRYFLLGEGGDEFMSTLDVDGSFVNAGEDVGYSLNMRVHQGAEYFESGYSDSLYEDLFLVRKYTNSFRYSSFAKTMSAYAPVRPPILKTNLLTKEPNYRACVKLWDFLQGYTKAGYKIEVTDYAPEFDRAVVEEFDALNLLQYVFLKNRMADYDERVCRMRQCKKRVIKPDFGDIEPTDEEGLIIKEKRGMTFGIGDDGKREFESVIRDALVKALRVERAKRRLAKEEERELDRIVKETLARSMREQKEEQETKQAAYEAAVRAMLAEALEKEKRQAERDAADRKLVESAVTRALKRDLNKEKTRTRRELEAAERARAEQEELMEAVLGDVLKLEAQRKFPGAHPGVMLGSQNLPVPDTSVAKELPVPKELSDLFDGMFVPPPPTEEEVEALIEEARRDEGLSQAEVLGEAADRPDGAALSDEEAADEVRRFVAEQRQSYERQLDEERQLPQQRHGNGEVAAVEDTPAQTLEMPVASAEVCPTQLGQATQAQADQTPDAVLDTAGRDHTGQGKTQAGGMPEQADGASSHTAPAPQEPEHLGFWRTLIRILFFWWKR